MSDINTAPTQLTEPKKYKTKFCFAVIPAALTALLTSIAIIGNIALIFSNSFYRDAYIITTVSNLIGSTFWIVFLIALLLKRPSNLLIPISLGGALISPTIINIIGNSILSKSEGWEYSITLWQVCYLLICFVAVAVCVLFTIKAPALKSFMKKTGIIWSIAIPSLYLTVQLVFSIVYKYSSAVLAVNLINYILYTATLFLLYFWLTNPYKEVTAVQTNPAPQYAQPVAFVQPVAVPVNPAVQPVVQPVPQVPVAAPVTVQTQTSVADEIAKYKALLDTGAITPEEFEALKVKLINKI